MSKIYTLPITANAGYLKSQPRSVTVSELIEALQELDQDAQIVTIDSGNDRGAKFGSINLRELYESI